MHYKRDCSRHWRLQKTTLKPDRQVRGRGKLKGQKGVIIIKKNLSELYRFCGYLVVFFLI